MRRTENKIMNLKDLAIIGVTAATVAGCASAKKEYASYELYPVRSGSLTEMEYSPTVTRFLYGHLRPTKFV